MKLTKVDFETSRDLKLLGFDEPCWEHYSYGDGDANPPLVGHTYRGGFLDTNGRDRAYTNSDLACVWNLPYGNFTAPSLALVIKWLRKKHGIAVQLETDFNNVLDSKYSINWTYYLRLLDIDADQDWIHKGHEDGRGTGQWITYEEAEINGIKEALEYIKNNKNEVSN